MLNEHYMLAIGYSSMKILQFQHFNIFIKYGNTQVIFTIFKKRGKINKTIHQMTFKSKYQKISELIIANYGKI